MSKPGPVSVELQQPSPPPVEHPREPLTVRLDDRRTLGQRLNTWLQNLAILGAGLWAIAVFLHREIVVPRNMPAHLNVSAELQKVGVRNGYAAVQLKLDVENTSTRTVYMLPAIYRLWGSRNDDDPLDEAGFTEAAQKNVLQSKDEMVSLYGSEASRTLIAVGRVFTNWNLNPGERATRVAVIHVPQEAYDTVIASFSLPISHLHEGFIFEWDPVDVGKSKLYFQPDRERGDRGEQIDWRDTGFKSRTGFAFANAKTVLSLWENDPGQPVPVNSRKAAPLGPVQTSLAAK